MLLNMIVQFTVYTVFVTSICAQVGQAHWCCRRVPQIRPKLWMSSISRPDAHTRFGCVICVVLSDEFNFQYCQVDFHILGTPMVWLHVAIDSWQMGSFIHLIDTEIIIRQDHTVTMRWGRWRAWTIKFDVGFDFWQQLGFDLFWVSIGFVVNGLTQTAARAD